MRPFVAASLILLGGLPLAGCPYVAPPTVPGARVRTTLGDFVVRLDFDNAPVSVANFLQYVSDDFYDGTIFHRVSPGFVIQGGGYTRDLVEKQTRAAIPSEASNGLSNLRGTIAMARADDPNSATAQFYINLADNTQLDTTDGQIGYTVFGEVIDGMDIVDLIAAVATEQRGGFSEIPVENVVIEDVEALELDQAGLELTPAGRVYLESVELRTINLFRLMLGQLFSFVLIPP